MQYSYIRSKSVRQLIKENDKRCGHTFLAALDRQTFAVIVRACKANGGNKRLNAAVIE